MKVRSIVQRRHEANTERLYERTLVLRDLKLNLNSLISHASINETKYYFQLLRIYSTTNLKKYTYNKFKLRKQ